MGKLSVELNNVNIIAILKNTIESILPTAEKKSIRIIESLKLSQAYVYADEHRLKQIFWNILSNAIKFTPPHGKIQIDINVVNKNLPHLIHISISDTGKGIKPEFLPFIFDLFHQVDSSSTRGHIGLGLGLVLVHSLLDMQGGKITAHSQGDNLGSTFTVTLPLIDSEQMFSAKKQNNLFADFKDSLENHYLHGLTILFVDDGYETREIIKAALSFFGATVFLAATVKEAYDLFKSNSFDIIISDIAMPDEDGYSLVNKIRQYETKQKQKNIVIALTAYAGSENVNKAIDAGFDAHLAKPFDISQLVQIIRDKTQIRSIA